MSYNELLEYSDAIDVTAVTRALVNYFYMLAMQKASSACTGTCTWYFKFVIYIEWADKK